MNGKINVFLELGKKRVFAGAIDWPGWCRSGKDEDSAQQAFLAYGLRYARLLGVSQRDFTPPKDLGALSIVERLDGNAGTDFGAPNVAPTVDQLPVDQADLSRFQALLEAFWSSFDETIQKAEGRELRSGPRGGGRSLAKIIQHVWEADLAYLSKLGGNFKAEAPANPSDSFPALRQAILAGLGASARGELPRQGPRGGTRWTARFYVRYSAWHLLDHLWEIEDRLL
jgi:hypothetical protein